MKGFLVLVVTILTVGASRVERQLSLSTKLCSRREPCTPLSRCLAFQQLLRQPIPGAIQRVQSAICFRDRIDVKVCCPGAIGIGDIFTTTEPVSGEALLPNRCGKPGTIFSGPGSSLSGSGPSLSRPSASFSGFDTSFSGFDTSFSGPSASFSRLSRSLSRPVGSSTKPSGSSTKPSGSSTKPSGSSTKPSGSSTKPSGSSTKPSGSSTKPSGNYPGPGSGFSGPGRRRRTARPLRPKLPGGLDGILVGPDKIDPVKPVAGGFNVELRQPYPWMAVLGYNSRTKPIWACGGSLITDRYVITAAHCVHNDFTQGLTLQVIRLGELNLSTEQDCERNGPIQLCAPPVQDYSPGDIIVHPDFNKRTRVSDDIALIRLDQRANLGQFVSPICLPGPGLTIIDLLNTGGPVFVSGWGLNETAGLSAEHLQAAILPYVKKEQCNPIYKNSLVPEQVCFGGGDKDSCQGDSGGPIFNRMNGAAQLVGLVSRGLDFRCGTEGIPAVYTDITHYRHWIVNNLKP